MTEIQTEPIDRIAPRVEREDQYAQYLQFTEAKHPDATLLARRIHAESYLGEGFILPDAIDTNGEVAPHLDKARGSAVTYYLGFNADRQAISTIRKVSTTESLGLDSLPGYQLCRESLTAEGAEALYKAELEGRPVVELAAFGHTPTVQAGAGFELLRHLMQQSQGSGEAWFFTMVTPKYRALVNRFGPRAVRKIGETVTIDDPHVNKEVTLTPAMVDTMSFFDDIAQGILEEKNTRRQQWMIAALRNFVEGLDTTQLSDDVQLLLRDEPQFNVAAYAEKKQSASQLPHWSEPLQFDMNNPIDALRTKKLIDDGKVRLSIDPPWNDVFDDLQHDPDEGQWVYFPWRESIVHFPIEATYRNARQARDRHLVKKEEQAVLARQTILYAGLSVGSHVAESMAYAGVGDRVILADFDKISLSNLNRLNASMHEVGEEKTDFVAKRISELDPYTSIQLLRDGITSESLETISAMPTMIFDAVDDFAAKALLRMFAKEHRIPLIMATDVGYKTVLDVERHDLHATPLFNGALSQDMIDAMLEGNLTPEQRMKIVTKLIGLSNASFRLLQSINDPVIDSFPQLGVTATQGGVLATIVASDILLGRKVSSRRHVLDARRAMGLPRQDSLRSGLKTLEDFLKKN